jgi:hypothetical protein
MLMTPFKLGRRRRITRTRTPAYHHTQTLRIIARPMLRITIPRSPRTSSPLVPVPKRPLDLEILRLGGILQHILRSLRQPPINKVPMTTKLVSTREFQRRRRTLPSIRQDVPEIIPNREPQSRDPIHTIRAAILVITRERPWVLRVRRFERLRVRAVGEEEEGLQVCGACFRWKGCFLFVFFGVVAFTEPGYPVVGVQV